MVVALIPFKLSLIGISRDAGKLASFHIPARGNIHQISVQYPYNTAVVRKLQLTEISAASWVQSEIYRNMSFSSVASWTPGKKTNIPIPVQVS